YIFPHKDQEIISSTSQQHRFIFTPAVAPSAS
ncbi:hypothetical protein A2U01_0048835, partial [Trifolium medium]|nr:hypothetical protein [Trifolium medium]